MLDLIRRIRDREHGAVLVTVVFWLPILLLFVIFVIDVGNWWEHRRHLQTQADAGALAAAGDLATMFGASACDDDQIEDTAQLYSGDEAGGYNLQVGGTSPDEVHFELNSATWFDQSSPVDDTVVEEPPCTAGMVDVKMTETDLPLFFHVADLFTNVPFINTHARVELFQREGLNDAVPLGIPDPNPTRVFVRFIDEASGTVLASEELQKGDPEGGLSIWDDLDSSSLLSLPVGSSNRIGLQVVLSGTTSVTCGDPLVSCYEIDTNGDFTGTGLSFIRGYSTTGTGAPNAPIARSVALTPGSCADPLLANPLFFELAAGTCTVTVHAEVDFGTCNLGASPGIGASLTATPSDGTANTIATATSCAGNLSQWDIPVTISAGTGVVDIALEWQRVRNLSPAGQQCRNNQGGPCRGTFGDVQRAYRAGAEVSGPIQAVHVMNANGALASSFPQGSDQPVRVKIGLTQSLDVRNAENANEDPVVLRQLGNQNGALDCDPDLLANLTYELAFGCAPEYVVNNGTECPDPATLWASPQPWDCVAIKPGNSEGHIFPGLNTRLGNSPGNCASPNNWADFPDLNPGDPRIAPVFLVPFGFGENGATGADETLPVTGFATFYITGYHGNPGNGQSSQSICPTDDPAETGEIVGHFIKYVDVLNEGGGGTQPCSTSELGPCVAVLTE
jgi:hypothetical protein